MGKKQKSYCRAEDDLCDVTHLIQPTSSIKNVSKVFSVEKEKIGSEIPKEILLTYPFSSSIYNMLKNYDLKEFLEKICQSKIINIVFERISLLIDGALQNKEILEAFPINSVNLFIYLVLKIVLTYLRKPILNNKIANLYSKLFYAKLTNETKKNIIIVCSFFKIKVECDNSSNFAWKMHYYNYLKSTELIKDNYRMLVNNQLNKGYVYLDKPDVIRLLQEKIRNKIVGGIITDNKEYNYNKQKLFEISTFKTFFESIEKKTFRIEDQKININLDKFSESNYEYTYEDYPPCVNHILKKAKEGINLRNEERLLIVWTLLALKEPKQKIIEIFSKQPDFDREKTEYQVNFAEKKEYIAYNCDLVESLGMCKKLDYNDKICLEGSYFSPKHNEYRKIRNPLVYVKIKNKRMKKS